MSRKSYWIIKIKYADGSFTYVYNKYCKYERRTLITPEKDKAQKYSSKYAAESWFDDIRKHWKINKEYTLEAEEVLI